MSKQSIILQDLVEKYKKDNDVRAILVYGSVSRGTETENSDIDLWIYKKTEGFVHRIEKVNGVKIDLFEISVPLLEKFLLGREAPAINSLLDGVFLFNKDIDTQKLINMAMEEKNKTFIPIETMPKGRILNVLIQLKDLIDDSRDLLNDPFSFRLVFSEVIVGLYNNIYDFFGIWRKSPKDTLSVFEKELPEIFLLLKPMLDDTVEPLVKVENAYKILEILAEKYGGIPDSHIITEIK